MISEKENVSNSFVENLKYDLPASLSVFLVAIPLCLGIAHASGTPLISGVITGVIGGIVVGFLSKSPLSVSGPAAGLTAIVLDGVSKLGSFEAFLLATFIAGLIQILLGLLKSGTIAGFLPNSVIKGMLSAIGLILIIKQMPHILGYDIEEIGVENFSDNQYDLNEESNEAPEEKSKVKTNSIILLAKSLSHLNYSVLTVSIVSIVLFLLWEKLFSKKFKTIPASLIVVIAGIFMNLIFTYLIPSLKLEAEHLVNLPIYASFGSFFNDITMPSFSSLSNINVYTVAFTIAMVASIESLLSVEAIEKIDPYKRKVSKNQELIAQGVGNSLTSMIGGIPLTSVIVRGSVNLSAGARSKASTIMHGAFLLLSVMFVPTLINMIPISSLAVILFFTGLKLASPKVFKASYKSGLDQFIPFLTTVIVILFTDLLIGILVGLLVSTFFILKEYYTNDSFELIDNGKNKSLVLKETVSFLNKARILEVLESIPSGSSLSVDGSNSNFIDNDILEILEDFKSTATYKNIDFVIGGVKGMSNYVSTYNEVQEAYKKLFNNNDNWVQEKLIEDPDYFKSLSKGQTPSFFCIGCSDSRVTINVITKTDLGQMFVHKNVANLVSPQDMNLMSALQYAVDVLKVKHIIVCGHYGCGGVKAALEGNASGVIENWLSQVRDTYNKHKKELDGIEDKHLKEERLVELNVKEQILNLQKTSIIQNAQKTYGLPLIHGWVYDINTGKIKELDVSKALV